jgi:predicted ATP-dependent endonuclease of OLD family
VHFQRLRLSGFKSFVDPTEFRIEPGLTGIVGPNGCGKSNLLEALRWVMGANSAKAMRAGGMDEVIFNGAASPHEQIILFDNTKVAAIRTADWKYVTRVHTRGWHLNVGRFNYPLLFDIRRDQGENYSVASLHPEVVADLRARHKAARDKYEKMVDLFPPWIRPSIADWHPD